MAGCKMDELKLQSEIVKSCKEGGGWASKIGSQHNAQAGVPDLWLAPAYCRMAVLAEVKWLGLWSELTEKKIPVTPLQEQFLLRADRSCTGSALLLVGYQENRTIRLMAVAPGDRYALYARGVGAPTIGRGTLLRWDMSELIDRYHNHYRGPKG
jgi:hypothetical protein